MTVMSKTVKGIIIAIISEVLYGLYASFSSRWSVVFFILAALGGEIVFLGLWLEKEADEANEKEHISNFLDEVRSIKLKSKIGWWILMGGIGFEVLTATGLAMRDDWEIRQIKNDNAKNDRLNQPISEISAFAVIKVSGFDFRETNSAFWWSPEIAHLILYETNILSSWINESNMLECYDFKRIPGYFVPQGPMRRMPNYPNEYLLNFYMSDSSYDIYGQMLAKDVINNVNVLRIDAGFIPDDEEVLGGSVEILINGGGTRKEFTISQQYPAKNWGGIYTIFATNSIPVKIKQP
jgi:hypothetical protein